MSKVKGLRKVIVPDAFIERVLTQGYRFDSMVEVEVGLPKGSRLVNVEHPAVRYGAAEPGAVALVFEHESFGESDSGEVPTYPVMTRLVTN